MARLSAVVKNKKREKLAKKYGPKAVILRAKAIDTKASEEEREAARLKLQKIQKKQKRQKALQQAFEQQAV